MCYCNIKKGVFILGNLLKTNNKKRLSGRTHVYHRHRIQVFHIADGWVGGKPMSHTDFPMDDPKIRFKTGNYRQLNVENILAIRGDKTCSEKKIIIK